MQLIENCGKFELSQTARKIIKFAPEEIDHIFTKHGETLRFLGLPFARVRKMLDREKSWFGIERKTPFCVKKVGRISELIEDLEITGVSILIINATIFSFSPEAWLESILRRNIKLLDANLILSPIYNQFRASQDKIDLLALRKDGRLVIIELRSRRTGR